MVNIKGGIKNRMKDIVVLNYRTKYKCGRLQEEIINYLWDRRKATIEEIVWYVLRNYGPRKGRIIETAWNKALRIAEEHGPKKGKLVYNVLETIKKLERRMIVSVKPSH